ncbi:expressed unknown protein [Seminavis robusta]|uniref:Uncharacterized protein n=1 Tax=Seminavis robusta TaxID=568900 RepID=A0A9N8DME2_9STRA|nr:expressed unknown protein [Seminavis robusta]|eukprot:Sro213_g088500.1 n/a (634) ;mRNA; f:55193-57220
MEDYYILVTWRRQAFAALLALVVILTLLEGHMEAQWTSSRRNMAGMRIKEKKDHQQRQSVPRMRGPSRNNINNVSAAVVHKKKNDTRPLKTGLKKQPNRTESSNETNFALLKDGPLPHNSRARSTSSILKKQPKRTRSFKNRGRSSSSPSFASLQSSFNNALQAMVQRGAMNSNISSRDQVLQHGFPRLWEPCVLLERLLVANNKTLEVVVLGGSASARPARDCTVEQEMPAQYSNLLQQRLSTMHSSSDDDDTLPKFRIINRAQGSMSSTTNALLMDQLIDPLTTDVIVWEFYINDECGAQGGGPSEQVRKLEFWLTRVQAIFAQAGRPPPPIILLYLWPKGAGNRLKRNETNTLKKVDPKGSLLVIDDHSYYRGWDIAVLNVAAAVDTSTVLANPSLLFDDAHHPSCTGVNLIADMLQHVFVTNLAAEQCSTTTTNGKIQQQHKRDGYGRPPHVGNMDSRWELLWTDLFRQNARLGSLTAWEPRIHHNASNLQVENMAEIYHWPNKTLVGKANPGRQDRKYAFVLPTCQTQEPLNITLLEPNLKWLGMSLTGNHIWLSLNHNKPVKLPEPDTSWNFANVFINQWIPVRQEVGEADKYVLSLCSSDSESIAYFQHLVGVSIPNDSDSFSGVS